MIRIFLFIIGFILMTLGITYIILYTNYITLGYNFKEYVNLISSKLECLLAPLGLIIIILTIYIKGGKSNGIYLWYIIKL